MDELVQSTVGKFVIVGSLQTDKRATQAIVKRRTGRHKACREQRMVYYTLGADYIIEWTGVHCGQVEIR